MKKNYKLNCKYCGKNQMFKFNPDDDYPTFDDVMSNDYEVICSSCGVPIRVNECLAEKIAGYRNFNIGRDHAELKKQIKEWELRIDKIVNFEYSNENIDYKVIEELEAISHEMMAINI